MVHEINYVHVLQGNTILFEIITFFDSKTIFYVTVTAIFRK